MEIPLDKKEILRKIDEKIPSFIERSELNQSKCRFIINAFFIWPNFCNITYDKKLHKITEIYIDDEIFDFNFEYN